MGWPPGTRPHYKHLPLARPTHRLPPQAVAMCLGPTKQPLPTHRQRRDRAHVPYGGIGANTHLVAELAPVRCRGWAAPELLTACRRAPARWGTTSWGPLGWCPPVLGVRGAAAGWRGRRGRCAVPSWRRRLLLAGAPGTAHTSWARIQGAAPRGLMGPRRARHPAPCPPYRLLAGPRDRWRRRAARRPDGGVPPADGKARPRAAAAGGAAPGGRVGGGVLQPGLLWASGPRLCVCGRVEKAVPEGPRAWQRLSVPRRAARLRPQSPATDGRCLCCRMRSGPSRRRPPRG